MLKYVDDFVCDIDVAQLRSRRMEDPRRSDGLHHGTFADLVANLTSIST